MSRTLPWALFGISALAGTASIVFVGLGSQTPRSIAYLVIAAAYAFVGAAVASRRPQNPIGWIFCAVGLLWSVGIAGDSYAGWSLATRDGALPATSTLAWISGWMWAPLIAAPLAALSLLFPTGRPMSPRWAVAGGAAALGLAIATVQLATDDTVALLGDTHEVANPYALEASVIETVLLPVGIAALAVGLIGCVASVVVRFRRSHGVEREQLKWICAALVAMAIAVVVGGALWDWFAQAYVITCLGLLVVPVATGAAILRYRLYGIDRLINRTVVYAGASALLAGVYFGLVLALQELFSSFAGGSDLAIAGSTLAVAALFRPVRGRVQALVDRRFYRRRYDAQRTLEAFAARLRDEVDLQSLATELHDVVEQTMQPARVSLWLRPTGGTR